MSWGAVAGAVVSGLGQHFANQQNVAFQKEMYKNRYQWQVEDLRKAGLNPILSVTGGGLTAPVTNTTPHQNVMGDASKYVSLAVNSAIADKEADIKLKEAQARQLDAETNAFRAQLESKRLFTLDLPLAKSQMSLNDSQIGLNGIYGAKAEAEKAYTLGAIDNEKLKLEGELELMRKQGSLFDAQGALSYASIKEIAPRIQKILAEETNLRLTNEEIIRRLQSAKESMKADFGRSWIGQGAHWIGALLSAVAPEESRFGIGFSIGRGR